MKYLAFMLAILAAPAAFAHAGAHLHPHGADSWLALVLAAVTVVGVLAVARAKARK